MSELIEKLRHEAAERAKDPEWFDEEFSQAIVKAADALEAKDALIAELVDALAVVRDRFFPSDQPERDQDLHWPLVNEALSKAQAAQS